MSQEEIRERNVRLVANVALDKFIEKGIGKTSLSEVALILPILQIQKRPDNRRRLLLLGAREGAYTRRA